MSAPNNNITAANDQTAGGPSHEALVAEAMSHPFREAESETAAALTEQLAAGEQLAATGATVDGPSLDELRQRLARRRAQDEAEQRLLQGHDLMLLHPDERAQVMRLRRELRETTQRSRESTRQQKARQGGVQILASEAFDEGVEITIEETYAGRMARRRQPNDPCDGVSLEASAGPGARVWIKFQRRREMQG